MFTRPYAACFSPVLRVLDCRIIARIRAQVSTNPSRRQASSAHALMRDRLCISASGQIILVSPDAVVV
ncbi:hypothetical protein HBI26_046030 [Parastagonospora nodorum]|nr:hypothetical protein HBH51_016460 [Parastagonospora nodorum]KAH4003437.1 hypothetical protein HBI10_055630 [Parastagonospora nodorum]KAH4029264.1 hypothetical protein HBI13_046700 [Parastagonospora nodorum]KAH4174651.1 hypothetical protein HBH43_079170 [Parastagonospora nodorum]KAH4210991.1 hypothetical protein HBI95_067180 [Parastagonospora nodorum]